MMSSPATAYPSAKKRLAKWNPIKPAVPVMRTFFMQGVPVSQKTVDPKRLGQNMNCLAIRRHFIFFGLRIYRKSNGTVEIMTHFLKLIRVHQWVKNLFMLLPLFFAGKLFEYDLLLD